ncbi:hypothetical protein BJV78DRAFT_1151310 [Lactifluus subvellereus]|nr:hypothetical protein BJV78DRAFT_1151310 [Lactifluus subvellereus]
MSEVRPVVTFPDVRRRISARGKSRAIKWGGPQPVGFIRAGSVVAQLSSAVLPPLLYPPHVWASEAIRHRNLPGVLQNIPLDTSTLWAGESDKWKEHPYPLSGDKREILSGGPLIGGDVGMGPKHGQYAMLGGGAVAYLSTCDLHLRATRNHAKIARVNLNGVQTRKEGLGHFLGRWAHEIPRRSLHQHDRIQGEIRASTGPQPQLART